MGGSRPTVYIHLSRDEVFLEVNAQRSSKVDAFSDTIRTDLEQFDVPSMVLLQELCCQGYQGGIAILCEYIQPLKASLVRSVTESFDTLPGRQAQMDWGECGWLRTGSDRLRSSQAYAESRHVRPVFRARNRCTPPAARHRAAR